MNFCKLCGKHLIQDGRTYCNACQMSSLTQVAVECDTVDTSSHDLQHLDDIKSKIKWLQICKGCGALVEISKACDVCKTVTENQCDITAATLGFDINPLTALQTCEVCGRLVQWGIGCVRCTMMGNKGLSVSCDLSTAQGKQANALEVCNVCGRLVGWGDICSRCHPDASTKRQYPDLKRDETMDKKKRGNVAEDIRIRWEKEQNELKQRLIIDDDDVVKEMKNSAKSGDFEGRQYYIGGMDISFVKGDDENACAALVVVSFPDLKVVYEDYQMVQLTAPYISGFLAFREAGFLIKLINKLKSSSPNYIPQVLFVDGNGLLHPREFGLACHLGVLLDMPCVGVAKTLLQTDGLEKNAAHTSRVKQLKKGGDTFKLQGASGYILGMALRSVDSATNPIFVSIGHRITLETAVFLVHQCCSYRIPEPVRWADLNSREFIRQHFSP